MADSSNNTRDNRLSGASVKVHACLLGDETRSSGDNPVAAADASIL